MALFISSKFKKTGSYLMELLMVVLGISIAFQLNVWNDARKSKETENYLLQNFIAENRLNQVEIDSILLNMSYTTEANPALIILLNSPKPNIDSIRFKMARLYSISWPDIASTHLDNYLDFSSVNSELKNEMLVLKTQYVSLSDLIDIYRIQKQQKYFDYLSDVVDITKGLEIVNSNKLFHVQFRNNLVTIYYYEEALRETYEKITVRQKKIAELIDEQLSK